MVPVSSFQFLVPVRYATLHYPTVRFDFLFSRFALSLCFWVAKGREPSVGSEVNVKGIREMEGHQVPRYLGLAAVWTRYKEDWPEAVKWWCGVVWE